MIKNNFGATLKTVSNEFPKECTISIIPMIFNTINCLAPSQRCFSDFSVKWRPYIRSSRQNPDFRQLSGFCFGITQLASSYQTFSRKVTKVWIFPRGSYIILPCASEAGSPTNRPGSDKQ